MSCTCAVRFLPDKRDRHTCQTAASAECADAYACHAVRDSYAGQIAASGECLIADTCHAVGDSYAGQIATIFKCFFFNADHRQAVDFCRNLGNGRRLAAIGDDIAVLLLIQRIGQAVLCAFGVIEVAILATMCKWIVVVLNRRKLQFSPRRFNSSIGIFEIFAARRTLPMLNVAL